MNLQDLANKRASKARRSGPSASRWWTRSKRRADSRGKQPTVPREEDLDHLGALNENSH